MSRIARVAILLAIIAIAAGFALAAITSAVAAVGVTLLMAVLVVVAAVGFAAPLRGAFLLLGLCIVLIDASFRVNVTGQLDIDSQIIGKLTLYAVSLLYAVAFVERGSLVPIEILAFWYTLALSLTSLYAMDPLIAVGGAFILWSQVLLSFAIRTRLTTPDLLARVWQVVIYSLVVKIAASWVLLAVNPSAALIEHDPFVQRVNEFAFPRFGGYFGPNGMGFCAALLGVLSLVAWLNAAQRRQRITATLFGMLAFASLVFSQSRTGLVAFIAGVLVVTALQHRRLFYATLLASALIAGYVVVSHRDILLGYATRGRDTDSLTSLEGRTEIWRALNDRILERPLFGYGYGAARSIVPQLQTGNPYETFYAAHDMFYESMLNGGIVVTGLLVILAVGVIVAGWRQLRRQPPGSKRYVALVGGLSTAAVLLVNGLAESGIAGIQNLPELLFYLVVATIAADQTIAEPSRSAMQDRGVSVASMAI